MRGGNDGIEGSEKKEKKEDRNINIKEGILLIRNGNINKMIIMKIKNVKKRRKSIKKIKKSF